MLVRQLLSDLISKSGVKVEDLDKVLNAIPESAVFDKDSATAINKALVSLDSAKSNSDLRKAFRAELYDGLDQTIADKLEEYGLDEKAKTALSGKKPISSKLNALFEMISEAGGSDGSDEGQKKASEAQEEVQKLQSKIARMEKEREKLISEATESKNRVAKLEGDLHETKTTGVLENALYGLKYSGDEATQRKILKSALRDELKDKGLKVATVDGEQRLVYSDDEGAVYQVDGKPVGVQDFVKDLAQNAGVLAGENPAGGGGNKPVKTKSVFGDSSSQVNPQGGGSGEPNPADQFIQDSDELLRELEAGSE